MSRSLLNFQAPEIIGLAAGESKEPERSLLLNYRTLCNSGLLIGDDFPWREAGLDNRVFAQAFVKLLKGEEPCSRETT